MSKEAMKLALEALEIRCGTHAEEREPKGAITALREALAKQPAPVQQEPVAFYVYKPTLPRGHLGTVSDGDLPWVYDQDPSSGFSARMLVAPVTSPPARQQEPVEPTQKMLDAPPNAYPADALVTWKAMLAAAPQPAQQQEPVGRTDQQIVDQTEELAVWLLSWCFNHQPETSTPMRESTHPFAQRCWAAACHIQEMLTATDPENAVAEMEGESGEEKSPQPAQQEPVAWMTKTGSVWKTKADETDTPLYTSPPAQRTWIGLTEADWKHLYDEFAMGQELDEFAEAIEAKLKEKNNG